MRRYNCGGSVQDLAEHYCKLVKLNIRKIKKEMDWTISIMSQKTSISEGYLGSILSLKNKKVPSIYMLGLICKAAKKDINYFFKE